MNTRNNTILEFCTKLLNNLFYKNKLIILIGKNGTTLSTLSWRQIQKSIFISNDDEKYLEKCRDFLQSHKKYYISFLLDNKDCTIKHEIIPSITWYIKHHPVEKFFQTHYDKSDIAAYNVYKIDKEDNNVWHSIIASSPLTSSINTLLSYTLNNSFKYNGVYFLSLELVTIIDNILTRLGKTEHLNDLQIFVATTQSSGIKIVVKHGLNIMEEFAAKTPENKSCLSTLGVIEQAISDKLLFYKRYIKQLNLNTCIIMLLNNKEQELAKNLLFDGCKTIIVSDSDLSLAKLSNDTKNQDNILINKFNKTRSYLILNKNLKSMAHLTLIHSFIIKPLFLLIVGLIITLSIIKYQSTITSSAIIDLDQQYYSLSKRYTNLLTSSSKTANIKELIDLYNLEQEMNIETIKPFNHLISLLSFDTPYIDITNINWKITPPTTTNKPESNLIIKVDLAYKGSAQSTINGIEILNSYATRLQSIFQDYQVIYNRDHSNIITIAKNVIIPASITIQGNIGGEKNDR
ncbi:MAG: hypothetical protein P8P83_05530 [Rickettsiaceae bacterium]|nr:hypothetical protein [Rickettsiaceae bacterium]